MKRTFLTLLTASLLTFAAFGQGRGAGPRGNRPHSNPPSGTGACTTCPKPGFGQGQGQRQGQGQGQHKGQQPGMRGKRTGPRDGSGPIHRPNTPPPPAPKPQG